MRTIITRSDWNLGRSIAVDVRYLPAYLVGNAPKYKDESCDSGLSADASYSEEEASKWRPLYAGSRTLMVIAFLITLWKVTAPPIIRIFLNNQHDAGHLMLIFLYAFVLLVIPPALGGAFNILNRQFDDK